MTGTINKLTIPLLAVFLFAGLNLSAQISSPQADAAKPVSYPVYSGTDMLYAFYQTNGSLKPGSLTATGPGAGTFDFTWTKYDEAADGFTIPVKAETNVTSSSVSNLGDGGYMVSVFNGVDVDTSFIAWVMLDNLLTKTEKNDDGKLASFRSGCSDGNYVIVAGSVELDTFYYYDPVSHVQILYPNDFEIEWTSDNPDLVIPNKNKVSAMGANYSENPPYKDTYYILTATDSLGMTDVDSVLYDTKHTKAEFTVEYYDKVIANTEEGKADTTIAWDASLTTEFSTDKGSLDAPLSVKFINESENGYEFTWVFVDTTEELTGIQTKEYEETSDKETQAVFTYFMASRYYYPYLVSISDAGCVDTFKLEDGIQVVDSQLDVPNAFSPKTKEQTPVALTPNDDGINDYFKLKHQSIKECKITIVDRRGVVVYKKRIDDMYAWDGWDGKILNSNRIAMEGQYYYVVEALGYDNKEYMAPNFFEQRKINKQQGNTTPDPTNPDAQATSTYTGWIYLFRNNLGGAAQ